MAGKTNVLRLDFCWGDLVVGNLAVPAGRRVNLTTPHGEPGWALWRAEDAACELHIGDDEWLIEPGDRVEHRGLGLVCSTSPQEQTRRFGVSVDSNLLHASMISIAAHVCAVAALWLSPEPSLAAESGGGVAIEQLRRYITVPAGSAAKNGPPRFVARGERPEEGERLLELADARGEVAPRVTRAQRTQSMSEALDAIVRELNNGAPDEELARAVGDLSWVEPTSAAISTAGFGGLPTPRPVIDSGNGSAIVGIGHSRLKSSLQTAIDEAEARFDDMRDRPEELPEVPELPGAENITSDPIDELPDEVRNHILRAVRERQNSIRYCYESWGLPRAPSRTGRLTLEFTLQPDGHLTDISAEIDEASLRLVAECAREQAGQWYLGSVLEAEKRLMFRFFLQPAPEDQARGTQSVR
jgi:hypothetical protein